jgi:hypothetical protein
MEMNRNYIFKNLVVAVIIIFFGYIGSLRCQAQENKPKQVPSQTKPQTGAISIKVWGSLKTSQGESIPNCETILEQLVGPGPYRIIATDRGAEYKFNIGILKLNKAFRLRARHPQAPEFGQGFTPSKKLFTAKMSQKFDFVYTGPLPDVIVTGITKALKPGSVNVRIKNIGGLAMGYFQVRFFYQIKNSAARIWKTGYKDKNVYGLAAGATADVGFIVPLVANEVIFAERIVLNNTDIRYPESSYANNVYIHK